MKKLLVIDPGLQGAIVWRRADGILNCASMKEQPGEIFSIMERAKNEGAEACLIEDVGHYMPGNSGPAAVTFAHHCGLIEMAAYVLFPTSVLWVRPAVWYKTIPVTKFLPLPKGMPADEVKRIKNERKVIHKREIKEFIHGTFPSFKITLKNADAFAMLHWYTQERGGE